VDASGALDGLLDLVFPRRCVQCGAAGGWLCEPCAGGLTRLPDERCPRCGAPGRYTPPGAAGREARAGATLDGCRRSPGRLCPECGARDFAFRSAGAAYTYEGAAKALVTACKFRALRSLTDEMALRAAPAFAAHAAPRAELVTWVPGHREHALERGFNQAELFARRLARDAGLPYAPLLRRVRHGARQSGLDRASRAANVRDAFALREERNGVLRRLKRVMVVDDVYTTGETLNQCAEVLARAGLEPHVFTFARTVRAASSQASLDHAVQKERCR
jgi:ComF family protein